MSALLKSVPAALLLPPLAATAQSSEDYGAPYRILQQANQQLDPSLAASAYASDGTLIFDYPGQPVEIFRGSDAIRKAYVRTFGQVDPRTPIALEWRRPDHRLWQVPSEAGQAGRRMALRRGSRRARHCGRL
jgi:hypothetical protein